MILTGITSHITERCMQKKNRVLHILCALIIHMTNINSQLTIK